MNLQIKEYLITEFEKLPKSKQEEVIDFIDFLSSKSNEISYNQADAIQKFIKKSEEIELQNFYAQHKFDSSDLKFNREEMNER